MKSLSSRAIILRRIDYGEADRIITLLTPDYGKLQVMAKGVRKAKSKLAGGIELFSVSEVHFIKGKGDIDTLVSTRMISHYGEIVKDIKRTELAYLMLRLTDRTLEDRTGQDHFNLLNESLAAVNSAKISPLTCELSFLMRMLELQGHVPDFSQGPDGSKLEYADSYEFDFEKVAFNVEQNGPFNKNHLKVMKLLAYNPPQKITLIKGINSYADELAPLVRNLAGQYIFN